jgi:hypothetical protein
VEIKDIYTIFIVSQMSTKQASELFTSYRLPQTYVHKNNIQIVKIKRKIFWFQGTLSCVGYFNFVLKNILLTVCPKMEEKGKNAW